MKKILNKKAISVVEYMILFVIIIGAFLIMQNYLQRGIYGSWAKTGQSFAFGRQYDSRKSIDCAFDGQSNLWYDYNCYAYHNSTDCPDGGTCDTSTNVCSNGNPCGCQGSVTCQESIITGDCSGSATNSACSQAGQ